MTLSSAGPDPRASSLWQARRLWSLWDMAHFSFTYMYSALRELAVLVQVSHKNQSLIVDASRAGIVYPHGDEKEEESFRQSVETIDYIAEACEKVLSELKCGHIDTAVKRLRHWAKSESKEWSELNTRARALRDAIEIELREHLFFLYPKDKGQKLLNWKTDWKVAIEAFPEINIDVFSAIDCYALNHNIASVFHLMRVAECGLRALARERGVTLPKNKPVEWATWQEVIKALETETKVIAMKKPGAAKDAALTFYSGALADLNGFKDEFRNLVMHVRANFDEFQAARALTYVHAFMTRLAAKIDHTRQRIDWGDL
jgi:hypothetical protein